MRKTRMRREQYAAKMRRWSIGGFIIGVLPYALLAPRGGTPLLLVADLFQGLVFAFAGVIVARLLVAWLFEPEG